MDPESHPLQKFILAHQGALPQQNIPLLTSKQASDLISSIIQASKTEQYFPRCYSSLLKLINKSEPVDTDFLNAIQLLIKNMPQVGSLNRSPFEIILCKIKEKSAETPAKWVAVKEVWKSKLKGNQTLSASFSMLIEDATGQDFQLALMCYDLLEEEQQIKKLQIIISLAIQYCENTPQSHEISSLFVEHGEQICASIADQAANSGDWPQIVELIWITLLFLLDNLNLHQKVIEKIVERDYLSSSSKRIFSIKRQLFIRSCQKYLQSGDQIILRLISRLVNDRFNMKMLTSYLKFVKSCAGGQLATQHTERFDRILGLLKEQPLLRLNQADQMYELNFWEMTANDSYLKKQIDKWPALLKFETQINLVQISRSSLKSKMEKQEFVILRLDQSRKDSPNSLNIIVSTNHLHQWQLSLQTPTKQTPLFPITDSRLSLTIEFTTLNLIKIQYKNKTKQIRQVRVSWIKIGKFDAYQQNHCFQNVTQFSLFEGTSKDKKLLFYLKHLMSSWHKGQQVVKSETHGFFNRKTSLEYQGLNLQSITPLSADSCSFMCKQIIFILISTPFHRFSDATSFNCFLKILIQHLSMFKFQSETEALSDSQKDIKFVLQYFLSSKLPAETLKIVPEFLKLIKLSEQERLQICIDEMYRLLLNNLSPTSKEGQVKNNPHEQTSDHEQMKKGRKNQKGQVFFLLLKQIISPLSRNSNTLLRLLEFTLLTMRIVQQRIKQEVKKKIDETQLIKEYCIEFLRGLLDILQLLQPPMEDKSKAKKVREAINSVVLRIPAIIMISHLDSFGFQPNTTEVNQRCYEIATTNSDDVKISNTLCLMQSYFDQLLKLGVYSVGPTFIWSVMEGFQYHQQSFNWDEEGQSLTYTNRIVLLGLYKACWKFIINNEGKKFKNKYMAALLKLNYCFPIYSEEDKELLGKIIRTYALCEEDVCPIRIRLLQSLSASKLSQFLKNSEQKINAINERDNSRKKFRLLSIKLRYYSQILWSPTFRDQSGQLGLVEGLKVSQACNIIKKVCFDPQSQDESSKCIQQCLEILKNLQQKLIGDKQLVGKQLVGKIKLLLHSLSEGLQQSSSKETKYLKSQLTVIHQAARRLLNELCLSFLPSQLQQQISETEPKKSKFLDDKPQMQEQNKKFQATLHSSLMEGLQDKILICSRLFEIKKQMTTSFCAPSQLKNDGSSWYYCLDEYLSQRSVKTFLKREDLSQESKIIPRLFERPSCMLSSFAKELQLEVVRLTNYMGQEQSKNDLVLLVSNSKIYQGTLEIKEHHLHFVEAKVPRQILYSQIYALKSQRRTVQEISFRPFQSSILISDISRVVRKTYLQQWKAVEISFNRLSLFFVFDDHQKREALIKAIGNSASKGQDIHSLVQQWRKGFFDNFEFVLKLNDIAGRSFNDISQYPIFPWVVQNFTQAMDDEFFHKPANLRNLTQPIGLVNEQKKKELLERFAEAKAFNNSTIGYSPHLFGAFYSNPAVVCNFLIRVNPFTLHHYQLQGNRFDYVDRLFISFESQFSSIYRNFSDFRELTPEFYCSPQFFRNRNKYNVNLNSSFEKKPTALLDFEVVFPKWVRSQTPEQFVFKMRRSLERDQITSNLLEWVDLIFGEKSEFKNAKECNNLYNAHLYPRIEDKKVNDFVKQQETSECRFTMLKQFGQVPRNIFGKKYPSLDVFKKIPQLISPEVRTKVDDKSKEEWNLICRSNFILRFSKKQVQILDPLTNMFATIQLQTQLIQDFCCLSLEGEALLILVCLNKNGGIQAIKIEVKKLKGSILSRTILLEPKQCSRKIRSMKDYLIVSQDSLVRIFQLEDIKRTGKKQMIQLHKGYTINQKTTLHLNRADIIALEVQESLGLAITVDAEGVANTFTIGSSVSIRGTFWIEKMKGKIDRIQINELGVILFLLNSHEIRLYNFYGDLIIANKLKQTICDIVFWNPNSSSQIVISTTSTTEKLSTTDNALYQFDLFDTFCGQDSSAFQSQNSLDIQKIAVSSSLKGLKSRVHKIGVKRWGKHWQLIAFNSQGVIIMVLESSKNLIKEIENLVIKRRINEGQ